MVAATGTGGEWVWVPLGDEEIPNTWQKKVYKFNGRSINKWAVWVDPDGKKYVKEDKVKERLREIKEMGRIENEHQSLSLNNSEVPVIKKDSENNTTCEICSLDFITTEEFASHQKFHGNTEDSSYQINTVHEYFPQTNLESTTAFPCDLCSKKYASKWGLNKHKEKHHSEMQNVANSLPINDVLMKMNLAKKSELFLREEGNLRTLDENISGQVDLKPEPVNNNDSDTVAEKKINDVPIPSNNDIVEKNISLSLLDPIPSVADMEVGEVNFKETNGDSDFNFLDDEEYIVKPKKNMFTFNEESKELDSNKSKDFGSFNLDTMSILDRYKHVLLKDVSSEENPVTSKKVVSSEISDNLQKNVNSESLHSLEKEFHSESLEVLATKADDPVPTPKFDKSIEITEFKETENGNTRVQSEESVDKVRKCMLCDETFTKKKRLIKHLIKHKENAIPTVKVKDQRAEVGTLEGYRNSILKKSEDNCYLEKTSESKSNEQDILKQTQLKNIKADNILNCISCGKVFKSKLTLKTHKEAIHDGVKYPCENCDYKATIKTNLKMHQQSRHGGVKFPCPSCDYKAPNTARLANHKRLKH